LPPTWQAVRYCPQTSGEVYFHHHCCCRCCCCYYYCCCCYWVGEEDRVETAVGSRPGTWTETSWTQSGRVKAAAWARGRPSPHPARPAQCCLAVRRRLAIGHPPNPEVVHRDSAPEEVVRTDCREVAVEDSPVGVAVRHPAGSVGRHRLRPGTVGRDTDSRRDRCSRTEDAVPPDFCRPVGHNHPTRQAGNHQVVPLHHLAVATSLTDFRRVVDRLDDQNWDSVDDLAAGS